MLIWIETRNSTLLCYGSARGLFPQREGECLLAWLTPVIARLPAAGISSLGRRQLWSSRDGSAMQLREW
jgi:hypothetical protein